MDWMDPMGWGAAAQRHGQYLQTTLEPGPATQASHRCWFQFLSPVAGVRWTGQPVKTAIKPNEQSTRCCPIGEYNVNVLNPALDRQSSQPASIALPFLALPALRVVPLPEVRWASRPPDSSCPATRHELQ
jgi:hypothetical protein